MRASTGVDCSISRETFSGRSSVSTTPTTKRSQGGSRPASSVMNMRRTCRRTRLCALALDRLEGLGAGDEQQRREVERALRAPVQRRPGLVEEVAEVAVELGVALLADLGLRLAPERRALVRRLVLAVAGDGDRDGDVVGPLADDRLQAEGLEELLGVGLEVQHDVGARLGAAGGDQRVLALALGGPGPGLVGAGPARGDLHPVGDHEGGVEADPELADEGGPVRRLRLGQGPAKASVPERAMVPRFCARSALAMPMPGSETVSVRAALSGRMRTFASAGSVRSGRVRASKRRRSMASAALATSSRRKISRSV